MVRIEGTPCIAQHYETVIIAEHIQYLLVTPPLVATLFCLTRNEWRADIQIQSDKNPDSDGIQTRCIEEYARQRNGDYPIYN